ncbi:MAG: hypothetical protein OHK0026_05680 [Rhodocyclaceae bacterium]
MNRCALCAILLSAFAAAPAAAHVSYTGRDFGSFDAASTQTVTISGQSVTGNYGWIDGADSDWGDAHRTRAFRFSITQAADVTLSFEQAAVSGKLMGLVPGFSVYQGLAHLPPDALDYDYSAVTTAYRAGLGFPTEGGFNALGDFKLGNDTGDLSTFTWKGSALDGSGWMGDGLPDNKVAATFHLAAGDYSVFVGGGDYLAQLPSNPNLIAGYGLSGTITVAAVPEPGTWAMLFAGLAVMGLVARRHAG